MRLDPCLAATSFSGQELTWNVGSEYKMLIIHALTLLLHLSYVVSYPDSHLGAEQAHFFNEWLVRISGGPIVARSLADQLGYDNLGEVPGFPDTYRMIRSDHPDLRKRNSVHLTRRLIRDARVLWAEQQFVKTRVKRDLIRIKRDRGGNYGVPHDIRFNDELWDHEWYLKDTRTIANLPKLDLHVVPVYDMNITGRGVRVTILDDGIEYTHTDLADNYDPEISFDVNDNDPDPFPRYDPRNTNSHGTRCAGEIAMVANNHKCGVGVAYNSKIGGIRMLDGKVNDRVEGTAMTFARHKVDIYSSSWGPNDDGKTVEGPGRLAHEALVRGVTQGREGKGVIYMWAAGNGGTHRDNCNCDGYTSSIFTLSIGSASEQGQFPWYGELCASTMAVTYSSGAYTDQKISTTDLHDTCTTSHTGTSAAAPLAAGIAALVLEANPSLTWRDMQHLVTWTSEEVPLRNNPGWQQNAAGFRVNLRFGFGLMNALGMVQSALNWTLVPNQRICHVQMDPSEVVVFGSGNPLSVQITTDACQGTEQEVNILEHVELVASISYPVRGALQIYLTSPSGTRVQVLTSRPKDMSKDGFIKWRFMSVHTWGENPSGDWRVEITDDTESGLEGQGLQFGLILYGTKEVPHHMRNGPRPYQEDYNKIQKKANTRSGSGKTIDELTNEIGKRPDWTDLVQQSLLVRNALTSRLTSLSPEDVIAARHLLHQLEDEMINDPDNSR